MRHDHHTHTLADAEHFSRAHAPDADRPDASDAEGLDSLPAVDPEESARIKAALVRLGVRR